MTQPELILITGGAGFIGSHLARSLVGLGQSVRVLDRLEEQVHEGSLPDLDGVELVRGDVVDREIVDASLDGVSQVVHFASAVGVGQSMYEIVRYCRTNVMGTAVLLEALAHRRDSIRKLLVASSMSIYGEGSYRCPACDVYREQERRPQDLAAGLWEPFCAHCGGKLIPIPTQESKSLRPSSVYAVNKRDQEELCLCVGRAYGIPTIALRFFNVYGPGQALGNPYTGAAAIFAARLLADAPPLIFEDGIQTRDLINVKDVVEACVKALSSDVADLALNVGTGRAVSVGEIAAALRATLGGPPAEILGIFRAGDIRHCFADASAARALLGWEAKISFEEGMQDLAQWLGSQTGDARRQVLAMSELRTRGLLGH